MRMMDVAGSSDHFELAEQGVDQDPDSKKDDGSDEEDGFQVVPRTFRR